MIAAVGQFMRYFADSRLTLDAVKKALVAVDPTSKIDGGEVSRADQLLAEIEITSPGSDMFADDINDMMGRLQQAGASDPVQRVQRAQSIMSVQILDTPDAMARLEPLWTVLAQLATGVWHVDGHGLYENGQLVARL
jgi:hypothetical protein